SGERVPKASDDLPEPDRPVSTTSRSRGMSTSMLLRLCARAPRTVMIPARFTALPAQRRPHPGDDRLDRALILRERGRALRLEPHHEHRLRARSTEQPPALRNPAPQAAA